MEGTEGKETETTATKRKKQRKKEEEEEEVDLVRWFSSAFLLIYVPIPIRGKRQLISRHYRPYVISRSPGSNVSSAATSSAPPGR